MLPGRIIISLTMFRLIQNIIIIALEDHFTAEEAKTLYTDLQKTLPKLKSGFILLTDLSLLKRIESGAYEYIKKAMELLNKYGVSKVIRIIPTSDKDRGFGVMSAFHYPKDIVIHVCKSFEEAHEFLE